MKKGEISAAIAVMFALVATIVANCCVIDISTDPHAAWVVDGFIFAATGLVSFGIALVALSVWEKTAPKSYQKKMKGLSSGITRFSEYLLED